MANRAMLPVIMALVTAFFATNAIAADPAGDYTGLLDLIQQSAASWDANLKGYATKLFWGLAVIHFVWTFFPLVFKQADFGEIIGELIRFILTVGFFFSLLLFSKDWAEAVVESFRIAGSSAAGLGGTGLKPGDIFTTAVELAKVIGDTSTWNPVAGVMIALAAAIVLLCFTFIAAFMGVTIIESFIVINASVLFMGFGGSQWTREYAIAIVRYAVSVGAKLFVLTLIVGLINQAALTWQAAYTADDASMWTMVGLSLACAYISKTIPDLIQGIISGSSMGGGAGLGGMAAAAVAGATAGAAAASGLLEGAAKSAAKDSASDSLSKSLDASLSGGPDIGNSTGSARGVSEGLGGNVGGSSSSESASASPRTSGAGVDTGSKSSSSASTGSPSSTSSTGTSQGTTEAPKASSSVQEAAKQADSGKKPNSEGNAAGAHGLANAAVRTSGMLAALSVPGMEGAAGLSLGSAPQGAESSENNDPNSSDFSENSSGVENTIRPSDAPVENQAAESSNTSQPAAPSTESTSSPAPQAPMDHATTNGAFQETAISEKDIKPAPKGDKE